VICGLDFARRCAIFFVLFKAKFLAGN